MIKYFFKTIFRHSLRYKLFTVLNITGLAIGMTVCLLISLYVQDELSFDHLQQDADWIFRVDMSNIWGDSEEHWGSTSPPIARLLKDNFPEIASVARIHTRGPLFFSVGEEGSEVKAFEEYRAFAVDSTFFDIFALQPIEGNLQETLKKPDMVILTQECAKKYFGDEDALGQQISLKVGGKKQTLEVGGIVHSLPEQSHFQFDILLSMATFPEVEDQEWVWVWTTFVTYIKVKEGTNVQELQEKIQHLPARYAGSALEKIYGYSFEDYEKQGKKWELFLLPLTDIHLFSEGSSNRLGATGDINYVYLLVSIGLLVMALAIINFVNLSTARATQRTKEVGVHKVLGSGKSRLIKMFLLESLLYGGIAMLIALALTELIAPFFNQISSKHLSLLHGTRPTFFLLLIGFTLLVSLLAGSYPAFYLSSFQPVKALTKKVVTGQSGKTLVLRNGLVAFQFAISIGLIIFTLVIQRQLQFVQDTKLGFDTENLLILHHAEQIPNQAEPLLNELRQDSRVASVSLTNVMPPLVYNEDNFKAYGSDKAGVPLNSMVVDAQYLPTLGIQLRAGRNFIEGSTSEQEKVILNEAAVSALGWSLNPDTSSYAVGQHLEYPRQLFEVIGIVPDFNFRTLREVVQPLAIFYEGSAMWTGDQQYIALRPGSENRSAGQIQELIADLEKKWLALNPQVPFKYSFLDDDYFHQFEAEKRLGKVFTTLTVLALFIACLGLYGLMTFVVERKQKEIGIRKVLGASVSQIFFQISGNFSRLVLLALLVTAPVVWYLTQKWLEKFAYRTEIPLWFYLVGGLGVLLVSLLSVSYQSIKAALANPVDSLKNE